MEKIKKIRAIYLLPSFFTNLNIFFGYLSILATFREKYLWAAYWIIIAAVMDAIDGIIAHSTKTQSDFGIQLDSLADAFSFGAAPSLLLYSWGFRGAGFPGFGIFFSFIFLAAGILRLARYNIIQMSKPNRKFYTGLTVPSASLLLAAIVLWHSQPIRTKLSTFLLAILVVILSLCMVSTIKYRNFLSFSFRKKINLQTTLLIAIIISSLIVYRHIFLLIFFAINVLSGPSIHTFKLLKKKIQKKSMPHKNGNSIGN